MNRSLLFLTLGVTITLTPAFAAPLLETPHIVVVGHGVVSSDPDVALVAFSVRGEGASSDAAATELVRKRAAISSGLIKLLGEEVPMTTGELSIREARDKACDRDDDQPRLSTGVCVVRGFVATMDVTIRISPVKDAGTALSLASRLGANDPQLSNFTLRSLVDARKRAETAAMNDAHSRAVGIAQASGSKLGRLISVEDQEARVPEAMDIIVTARRRVDGSQEPPPVSIDLKPMPIRTAATLTVTYAIEP